MFLFSIFQYNSEVKLSFDLNSVCKNSLLGAFGGWDGKFLLREVLKTFMLTGSIGYGNSYLEFIFCHFGVFRLHAILHNVVIKVQSQSGTGLVYSCTFGSGPNSCVLVHMIGILLGLYVKLSLPSISKNVDF